MTESKTEALTDAKLNNAFISRGFGDLSILLESGFKQLERFYSEKGAQMAEEEAAQGGSSSVGGALWSKTREGQTKQRAGHPGSSMLTAIEETMHNLRSEDDEARLPHMAILPSGDASLPLIGQLSLHVALS